MAGQYLGALPSTQADWSGVADAIGRALGWASQPQAPQPLPTAQAPVPLIPAAFQRPAAPMAQPAPRAIPLPPARPSPASPAPIDPWTALAPDNAAALAAASTIPTSFRPP